jgi:hypothetical protein
MTAMNDEPKSGPRRFPNIWLNLGIGIGVAGAFALVNIPNWRIVSGCLILGAGLGIDVDVRAGATTETLSSRANRQLSLFKRPHHPANRQGHALQNLTGTTKKAG